MKILTLAVTSLAIVAGLFLIGTFVNSLWNLLFFASFALWPLFVTLPIAFLARRPFAQAMLLVSTLLYIPWFLHVVLGAFHWHPGPQSAIGVLFIGFYSVPVMVPLWVIAFNKRHPAGH